MRKSLIAIVTASLALTPVYIDNTFALDNYHTDAQIEAISRKGQKALEQERRLRYYDPSALKPSEYGAICSRAAATFGRTDFVGIIHKIPIKIVKDVFPSFYGYSHVKSTTKDDEAAHFYRKDAKNPDWDVAILETNGEIVQVYFRNGPNREIKEKGSGASILVQYDLSFNFNSSNVSVPQEHNFDAKMIDVEKLLRHAEMSYLTCTDGDRISFEKKFKWPLYKKLKQPNTKSHPVRKNMLKPRH